MGSSGSGGNETTAAPDKDGGLGVTGAGLPAPSVPGSWWGPLPRELKPRRVTVSRTATAIFRAPRHQPRRRLRLARRSLRARSSVNPLNIFQSIIRRPAIRVNRLSTAATTPTAAPSSAERGSGDIDGCLACRTFANPS
jgi:hypothetical protein